MEFKIGKLDNNLEGAGMDFDNIEALSDEEVLSLYADEIMEMDNVHISMCKCTYGFFIGYYSYGCSFGIYSLAECDIMCRQHLRWGNATSWDGGCECTGQWGVFTSWAGEAWLAKCSNRTRRSIR